MDSNEKDMEHKIFPPAYMPSFFELFNGLTWLAFLLSCLSTLLALYLLLYKLKFSPSRWKAGDRHYKLRVAACFVLFASRIIQLAEQMVFAKRNTFLNAQTGSDVKPTEVYKQYIEPLRSARETLNFFWQASIYPILVLMLFLTMDRYVRVMMVLPNTRLYHLFKAVVYVYVPSVVFIALGYISFGATFIIENAGQVRISSSFQLFVGIRQIVEVTCLTIGFPMDYFLTILLCKSCLQGVGKKQEQHCLVPLTANRPRRPSLWIQLSKVEKQKIKVAFKTSALFFGIFIIDTSIAIFFVVSQAFPKIIPLSYDDWQSTLSILGSWIAIRIWLTFELLDIFLQQLKQAKAAAKVVAKDTKEPTSLPDPSSKQSTIARTLSLDKIRRFDSYSGRSFSDKLKKEWEEFSGDEKNVNQSIFSEFVPNAASTMDDDDE